MSRAIRLILVVVLGAVGGAMAFRPAYNFGIDWYGRHLAVVQDQLADLKGMLADYRAKHGRYPTNDEGLGVLDNFESRFSARFSFGPTLDRTTWRPFADRGRLWWLTAKQEMGQFRQQHRRAPATAAEFESIYPLALDRDEPGVELELAVTRNDNVFVLTPAGVMSPWMMPYMYENRAGFDPAVFAGSPVEAHAESRYSICVDEGLYVYAVGGQTLAENFDEARWRAKRPKFVGGALLLVGLVMTISLVRRKWWVAIGVLLLAGSAAVGGATRGGFTTCYVMMSPFRRRDMDVAVQRALLDKYRAAGVINLQTYQKAVSALDHPFPTTTQEEEH